MKICFSFLGAVSKQFRSSFFKYKVYQFGSQFTSYKTLTKRLPDLIITSLNYGIQKNCSVWRQRGLTTSHLHTQLDPFVSKLLNCSFKFFTAGIVKILVIHTGVCLWCNVSRSIGQAIDPAQGAWFTANIHPISPGCSRSSIVVQC